MEFTQDQKNYAQIVQKAWEDAEFKKELVADPAAAIEKLLGKKLDLPAGKRLVVRDQTDESTLFINIPAKAKKADDLELNEEQLEAVAGGVNSMISTILVLPTIATTLVPTPTFPTKPLDF